MQEKIFFNALKIALKDSFYKIEKIKTVSLTFEFIWKNLEKFKRDLKIDLVENNLDPEKEFLFLEKNQIKIVLKDDIEYPLLLKEIHQPPLGLYVKGDISSINKNINLAVIGSRKSTGYGKLACERIINGLANSKINIISGLALGIDSWSHNLALQNNLKTFAFIGSGFNCLFPSANKNLSEKIIKTGGAIISEYPINASPQKHYFVARNRLISGSSKAVLIVEAQEKSGTLITARFAMEQDRDILAIPNNIFEKNSKGTNNLIREGAVLVESAEDVFEELGIEKNLALDFEKIDVSLSKVQKEIVNLFEKNNEIDVDFIYENLGLPVEAILSELTILELEGIIRQTKNEAYIKII